MKRLYRNPEHAKNLVWHANEKVKDGHLRHPANSPSWKLVDQKFPDFSVDPRNLRLGLSTDGINHHITLISRYSCRPVILVNYNLPPSLCMKRKFMMLTLLISGSKQPGNDIDVYLKPLIEDLKSLWKEEEQSYDAYGNKYFTLRGILLWTTSDFPAYKNLSSKKVLCMSNL